MAGGSSMIGFPRVIADSEGDMPGIKVWLVLWQTELQEVRQSLTNAEF